MAEASPQNRPAVTFDRAARPRLIPAAIQFVANLGQDRNSLLSFRTGKAKQGQQKTIAAHFSVDGTACRADAFIIPQSKKKKRG